jgi:hypothetical protein
LQPKTKQQQKRLSANVRQAKSAKADYKSAAKKKPAAKTPPAKQTGGVLDKLFGGKPPKTAQQSIPYRVMYRDGICRVNERLYTKTIVFSDINYHLAQNDDKTQIFENYCDFLNYFDSSVSVQLSFVNQYGNPEEFQRSIDIPLTGDEYDPVRAEFADMLKNQLAKGNNGLTKTKYVTFGIEADNLKAAKLRIERVEADILNNFKTLGVSARSLSGAERLEILHNQFHPDGGDKFVFDWKTRVSSGLSTKDFIAPSSFDFQDGKTFMMGGHIGAVSYLQILAPELTDRMLADFLDMDAPVTVTLHIQSIDQSEAIKTVKRKLSDLDAMKIQEQKKAVRSGYDMDIIPTDLATYGNEAKTLLEDLQSRNERMFLATIIVLNTAKKKQKLDNDIFAAASVAQKYNCALKRLDWQQEQGLMSSLPLGVNQIEIKRGLTTSSVAIFVPFTTCELFQRGEAMYYGLNALSNNLIMASRKELKNPNGLYCQGRFPNRTLNGGLTLAAQADEHRNPYKTERSIPGMKMRPKRKTAIYCRTALEDDIKIAAQKRLLRAYAEEHDYTDIILYRDCGAAGNTLDRPALNRLTSDIATGEISAVLVTNTSRIARNFTLVSEWLEILDKHEVALIAAQDGAEVSHTELTYRRVGDYLLPNIVLSEQPGEHPPLGRYGRMRKAFLKEHRPIEYSRLLMTEQLFPHLRETDAICDERRKNGCAESVIVKEIVCEI